MLQGFGILEGAGDNPDISSKLSAVVIRICPAPVAATAATPARIASRCRRLGLATSSRWLQQSLFAADAAADTAARLAHSGTFMSSPRIFTYAILCFGAPFPRVGLLQSRVYSASGIADNAAVDASTEDIAGILFKMLPKIPPPILHSD
ncbi:hypothetical protein Daesc_004849 [Daldinia eschscholtzii]|uniref:Uncharacterized protein n=1 Tax=Daldinia eschscholtzii TaxID=292717 RepID=A0AAX6MR52_9PEZI